MTVNNSKVGYEEKGKKRAVAQRENEKRRIPFFRKTENIRGHVEDRSLLSVM